MTRVHVITPVPLLSHLFNLSLIPFSFTFLHLTMPSFSFLSHLPSFPPHRPPSSSRLWSSYHLCPFITHILLLSSSLLDHLPLVLGQFSLVLHSCNFHSVFSLFLPVPSFLNRMSYFLPSLSSSFSSPLFTPRLSSSSLWACMGTAPFTLSPPSRPYLAILLKSPNILPSPILCSFPPFYFLLSFLSPSTRPSTHPYLDRERHVPEQDQGAARSREGRCALLPPLFRVFHRLPALPHGCTRHPRLSGRRGRAAGDPQAGRRRGYHGRRWCWQQWRRTFKRGRRTPAPVTHVPEHHRCACSLYGYHDCG